MPTITEHHPSAVLRKSVLLLACSTALRSLACGQAELNQPAKTTETSQSDQIATWMKQAKEDTPESVNFAVRLAEARAVQAIPMLEEKYSRTSSNFDEAHLLGASVTVADLDKANLASVLIRLGDKKEIYWNYLIKQATLALEMDIPKYLSYDEKGKAGSGPSPQLSAWAAAHHVPAAAMEEEVMGELPAAVSVLGHTGDPRAIPLLRRALLSPNPQIQRAGARGLAYLQDRDSIPLIVEACRRAPAEAAAMIAGVSLAYFDTPDAQEAAETYIPQERLKALREYRSRYAGNDPYR